MPTFRAAVLNVGASWDSYFSLTEQDGILLGGGDRFTEDKRVHWGMKSGFAGSLRLQSLGNASLVFSPKDNLRQLLIA